MKFTAFFFALAFIFSSMQTAEAATSISPDNTTHLKKLPPRWEKLGTRKVNYRLDRDEIPVTLREGVFTALKFKVRGGGVNMHKMVVHFRNGDRQEVELRGKIPAGGESRVIDLKGNRRVITKVVFWYDTKNFSGRRATISLWGRH